MNYKPCSERTFLFQLAPFVLGKYEGYSRWLHHLLERLGQECTYAVWHAAFTESEDDLLLNILAEGWEEVPAEQDVDMGDRIDGIYSRFFSLPVAGVTGEEARQWVELTPPLAQVRKRFPAFSVGKQITAYEALHLRFDGVARLVEALTDLHGKQGELIAYDLMVVQRLSAGEGWTGSVEEFISESISEPEQPNIFTAGLEDEVIRASDRELVLQVKECEWARYFRERHPDVGYLIACSTDEAAFKAYNQNLRLQRTATLMEGGEVCDFKIYAVEG